MKRIVFLFMVMIFFAGCRSGNLLNGEKKYIINTDCGRVQLTSARVRATGVNVKLKPLDGELKINVDSAILEYPLTGTRIHTRVYHKNKEVKGYFLLKKKDVLLYRIHVSFPINLNGDYSENYNKNYIVPNDFILCNGEPVITDTIRISRPPLPRRISKP